MKKKSNNKGFTLIELLAVIVIMGVLMMVAIPAVTKYINSSKKSAFADSAGAYINAARYSLLNGEYDCQAPAADNQVVNIGLDQIDIDKGTGKSPYGKNYVKPANTNDTTTSYVKAAYVGGKIEYSICLVDEAENGTNGLKAEKALDGDAITVKESASCTMPSDNKCIKG